LFTDFQQDDGQEIYQLTFSPNGTKLVFCPRRAANGKGQHPNPASLTEGTEQAIYFRDINSKNPAAKITQGSSPLFYPDGFENSLCQGRSDL